MRGIHGRAHVTGLACVRRIFCNVCVSLQQLVCVYTMATDGLEPIALFAATYAAGTQNVPAVPGSEPHVP